MRKTALQEQPRLSGEIMRTADPSLKPLLKQIEEMHGVAALVQTHDGGQLPVRINRNGGAPVIEAFSDGKWQALGGPGVVTEVTKTVSAPTSVSGSVSEGVSLLHDHSQRSEGLPIPTDGIRDRAVTPAKMESGTASAHQVFSADGDGGVVFEEVVHKSGDEAVGGVKTFEHLKSSFAPVSAEDVANKSYVDSSIYLADWEVLDIRSDPPSDPAINDKYIVKPSGTGVWETFDNDILTWGWNEVPELAWIFSGYPAEGTAVYSCREKKIYVFDGSAWNPLSGNGGSVWRDGHGVPSPSLGADGDYYLDDLTGDVYIRASGIYSLAANIKGAKGDAGVDVLTTLGDILYENADDAPARLAGNTSTTRKLLTQTGTGSVSAAPAWDTLKAADLWAVRSLNPQWLLEETFEKVIQGTLSTGNATPASVTRTFGNASTDNNGIATWSGAGWSSTTGLRVTSTTNDYFEVTVRTDGTNDIVLDRSSTFMGSRDTCGVVLDGVSQTAWNQITSKTYTLSSVAAGVHTIRVTCAGGGSTMRIASIQYRQLPYQGVEAAGDVVEIVYVPSWVSVTSIGIGAINNGATYNNGTIGESIIHRLPLGSALDDTVFARDSVVTSGMTATSPYSTGVWRYPIVTELAGSSVRSILRPGASVTISATSGIRGKCFTSDIALTAGCPACNASVYRLPTLPMIGVVTAVGVGSLLNIGDTVLLVVTQNGAGSGNSIGVSLVTTVSTQIACGIYKLP